MAKLQKLFEILDISVAEFKQSLLGMVVESRSEEISPEHILAALAGIPDSYTCRRIKQQQIKPENVVEVLKACLENEARTLPAIQTLDNPPLSAKTDEIIRDVTKWSAGAGKGRKLKERDFLALLVAAAPPDSVETLVEFANIDWDAFKGNRAWPPPREETAIALWDKKTGKLLVDTAFGKSGKKLIGAFEAETEGLGLREYSVEAFFIALLNFERSVLDLAIRTQLTGKDAYISSTNDLILELRNRIRKPRLMKELEGISHQNCQNRLENIFDRAAEIACDDSRKKISAGDMTEALARVEAKGRLGHFLKAFKVDLEKVYDFLETYIEDVEVEENLIPITGIEEHVKQNIIGQDHAVERILPLIKRLRFGYRRPGKPAGVFLFMGPSGTGKTEMAKVLARSLYGAEDNMIMLEMGQFGTKESKSMFIGASPGYVGYGEGKLTNGLRDNPECVILFDEVEKADPLVLDVLLRFLDEGKIDDPAGPVRDGSKCLIVLTCNVQPEELDKYEQHMQSADRQVQEDVYRSLRQLLLDFGKKEQSDEKIRKFFRPEFIFRIDEVILFRSFNRKDFKKIAEINLDREIAFLKENYDYTVSYDPAILEKIADESEARRIEGARVINRLINVIVVNPIIDFITAHPQNDFQKLHLSYEETAEIVRVVKKK